MLNQNIFKYGALITLMIVVMLHSCAPADGEFQGHEYMPDMKHSIAYEANYYNYYSLNTWGTEDEYHKFVGPRKPVEGTLPRGYAGIPEEKLQEGMTWEAKAQPAVDLNGYVPYYYGDSEDERTRASNEITQNPIPITQSGLELGEELYNINCGICHGEKGDGLGYLVRDDGGVYPAAPANFLLDTFLKSTPGRYYHSIMYGKNVMGAYKDKLNYRERWEVIHWIRALQAKEQGKEYNAEDNTLNDFAQPIAMVEGHGMNDTDTTSMEMDGDQHDMEDGMHQQDEESHSGEASHNDESH
jgi:mono/diheme cytochrome c family protein